MDAAQPHAELGPVRAAVTARGWFDYRHMFDLDETTLVHGQIVDCPAGASPFGAQARARGGEVTSVDPIYTEPVDAILQRVAGNLDRAPEWLTAHQDAIDWNYLGSADAHIRASETAADLFAADYASHPRHYVPAALPRLPFPDRTFALAVSANLLFAYPDQLGPDAHVAALVELARVTRGEVRVHPVVDTSGTTYPHLDSVRAALADHGISTSLRQVDKAWLIHGRHTLICWSSPGVTAEHPSDRPVARV